MWLVMVLVLADCMWLKILSLTVLLPIQLGGGGEAYLSPGLGDPPPPNIEHTINTISRLAPI